MRYKFLNPFFLYSVAFIFSIVLYHLKLSALYRIDTNFIEMAVILTVILAVIISFFYGVVFKKYLKRKYKEDITKRNQYLIIVFLIIASAAEFIYAGTIPVIGILSGSLYDYRDFGIPMFHVFFMSYISAHAILSFDRAISGLGRYNWLGFWFGMAYSVAIVSRGTAILILLPCALIYISQKTSKKAMIILSSMVLLAVLMFGWLGDARFKAQGVDISNPIYKIAQIDRSVESIGLPSGFVWVYAYLSSPYGNLLYQEKVGTGDQYGFSDFLITSVAPDFIAKRIVGDDKYKIPRLLTDELNVSTGYASPYITIGELGILLFFLYFTAFSFFFAFLNRNRYIIPVAAILASVGALLTFFNMLIFSTCALQLFLITFSGRHTYNGMRLI